MPLALSSLRVGRKYYLINDGERHDFQVMRALGGDRFVVKDILTLEVYELQELFKYGLREDFDLREEEKV
ncbi:MAG: hypothetical protein MUE33_08180 [Cytophagaceae bacterium]|jgi:hypothetical protein|nr:hypothetical protein [Cytophagaceae bacterium]